MLEGVLLHLRYSVPCKLLAPLLLQGAMCEVAQAVQHARSKGGSEEVTV